jgi:hypothetical protein
MAANDTSIYPEGMKTIKKGEALAAFRLGQYESAARLFTEAHLEGRLTHYVVLPAIPDNTHLCAITANWTREVGPEFMWIIRSQARAFGDAYDGWEFQIQTGKCGAHQRFAFKIVPYGGFEDEGFE